MSFNNVSQVIVAGPAINNVARDQFNVTAEVVHIGSRADEEPTEYDEFKRLKKGDVYLLKEIYRNEILACHHPYWNCQCNTRCMVKTTIYDVELVKHKSKFTAIEYNGPEAREVWERDFRRFSQNRSPDAWQLYGLNRSSVPFLIFHDVLVPLGHFYKNSFWGDFFVEWLRRKIGCDESEVWLNARGSLIKGPQGPHFAVTWAEIIDEISIPSSAEMLTDDISFQFFQKFPSTMLDHFMVEFAREHCSYSLFDDVTRFLHEEPFNIPLENTQGILDGLRVDTVYSPSLGAVARCRDGGALWKTWSRRGLVDKTVMESGLIRFKQDGPDVCAQFSFYGLEFEDSWLSQSSRIIDACRMWGTEEQCFIVNLPGHFILHSIRRRYLNQQRLLPFENPLPIYLFVYPLPMTVSEIESWKKNRTHFWSLDKNGWSEMTEEECRRWGVPELTTDGQYYGPDVYTWPSHVYAAIRNWQFACGFDPTTADFARSLGHPEFDILINNEATRSWFEELHENLSTPDRQSNQSGPDTSLAVEVAIPQPSLTTSTTETSRITVPPKHSMVKTQPRAETSPQVQPVVKNSDPVSILGKRKRGGQIHTRRVRRRV